MLSCFFKKKCVVLLLVFFVIGAIEAMNPHEIMEDGREYYTSMVSTQVHQDADTAMTPKSDIIFKMLFGNKDHPRILINLLNAVIKPSFAINEVQIEQTELTPEHVGDKSVRLDVLAKTGSGEIINVEIQRRDEGNMLPRTLFYWSKLFAGQAVVGQDYKTLRRTVCINILDFSLFKDTEYWHKLFLMDERTKERLTDLLEIHFLELGTFSKVEEGRVNTSEPVTFWLEFLNSPTSEAIRDVPEISEAKELYERVISDPSTRELYRTREKGLMDYYSAVTSAKTEGHAEGAHQQAIETARRLLSTSNLTIEQIADATRLPIETIQQLQ